MATLTGLVYADDGSLAQGRVVRVYRRDDGSMLGEGVTGDGGTTPGDPYYDDVALLLHMGGLSDSSSHAHTASLVSPGSIVASASRFGGSSFTPGAGGAMTVPSHASFALPADFTIECWVYASALSGLAGVFNIGNYASGVLLRLSASGIALFILGAEAGATCSIATGVWHHVAVSRSSGTVRLFLDGVSYASYTNTSSIPAAKITVGRSDHYPSEYLSGYVNDLRVTAGVARYTADFSVPAGPAPDSAEGVVREAGRYTFNLVFSGEVQRVVLDDSAGDMYNDILDRVVV